MALTSLSPSLRQKIKDSKILVVGAGGIGCELLKNLVLIGFEDIHVIDLDTIEVSNLNRQFLFQKQHVGKSKAEVARESCLKFNPDAKISAHHGSVISPTYNLEYFKQFKVVLNALDNVAARSHVNRVCLAAEVPLIESGTAGYEGQVEPIIKGTTGCYDCQGKRQPKTYPTCTIRMTPSEHIHCTVWAKYVFNMVFGEPEEMDEEDVGFTESAESKDKKSEKSLRELMDETDYDPIKLFQRLFHDDITYLLTLKDVWKERSPPKPVAWDDDLPDEGTSHVIPASVIEDQRIWTFEQCKKRFSDAVIALKKATKELKDGDHLVWEKDDDAIMDFVASCANLRARNFGIEQKSRFEIKSMAGNIVPAIATSNAIIAGIIVLRAIKVIEGNMEACKVVYLRSGLTARGDLIVPEKSFLPPNPKCYVCSSKQIVLVTNVKKLMIKELHKNVLLGYLKMVEPEAFFDKKIVVSSEEDELEGIADKTLSDFGIESGSVLTVEDYMQNYELIVKIKHVDELSDPDSKFEIEGDVDSSKRETKAAEEKSDNGDVNGKTSNEDTTELSDEEIEIIEHTPSGENKTPLKRSGESSPLAPAKKRKLDSDNAVIID